MLSARSAVPRMVTRALLGTLDELRHRVMRYIAINRGQIKIETRLIEWAASDATIAATGYQLLGDTVLSAHEFAFKTSGNSLSIQKTIVPARLTILLQRCEAYIGLCADRGRRSNEISSWVAEMREDLDLVRRIFAACGYDLPASLRIIVLLAPVKGNDGYATFPDASRAMLRKAVEFGRRRSSQLGNQGGGRHNPPSLPRSTGRAHPR